MTWTAQFGGETSTPEEESTIVEKIKAFFADLGAEWSQLTTSHHGSGAVHEVADTPLNDPTQPIDAEVNQPSEPVTPTVEQESGPAVNPVGQANAVETHDATTATDEPPAEPAADVSETTEAPPQQ